MLDHNADAPEVSVETVLWITRSRDVNSKLVVSHNVYRHYTPLRVNVKSFLISLNEILVL